MIKVLYKKNPQNIRSKLWNFFNTTQTCTLISNQFDYNYFKSLIIRDILSVLEEESRSFIKELK